MGASRETVVRGSRISSSIYTDKKAFKTGNNNMGDVGELNADDISGGHKFTFFKE